MKFNWDEFKNEKIAVLCDTEDKAIEFIKECFKRGMKWRDQSFNTFWKVYKENTTYTFNFINDIYLGYANITFHQKHGCKIIKWRA